MIEFLLGLVIGTLLPEEAGKFCCGCLVVIFGGGFALMALIFALAANDQPAMSRVFAGFFGLGIGWFVIAIIRRIAR